MSPHGVSNLVTDLVEMARATERLPQIEAECARLRIELHNARETIQHRELRIIELKTEADESKAATRKAEVDRDDAELRFLEADERTSRALDFIKTTFGNAGALIQALEPPKEVHPIPMSPPVETSLSSSTGIEERSGESHGFPTLAAQAAIEDSIPQATEVSYPDPTSPTVGASTVSDAIHSTPPVVQEAKTDGDVSVPTDPTAPMSHGSSFEGAQSSPAPTPADVSPEGESAPHPTADAHPTPAPSTTATSQDGASTRYAGKLYRQVLGWVSREEWLAGGGTDATYDWHVGDPIPDGIAA